MNRFLVIFFSFLILSSSAGLVFAKHFCGGELVEAGLFKEIESCCGDEMPSDCCDLEQEILQHDDNTQVSFQTIDSPEQELLDVLVLPIFDQVFIKDKFVDLSFLLRPLTVPDRLARIQSFLL